MIKVQRLEIDFPSFKNGFEVFLRIVLRVATEGEGDRGPALLVVEILEPARSFESLRYFCGRVYRGVNRGGTDLSPTELGVV